MNTLSPSELFERAPGAQPLAKKHSPGLIDTNEFMAVIRKTLGHKPVMAVQGRAHSDVDGMSKKAAIAKRERQGRHLIVCADESSGAATIVLNSHTVRRKAWIAAGFYEPKRGLLLVGVALPLQRWRGYKTALDELERYRAQLTRARRELRQRAPQGPEIDAFAERVSKEAYLPGHKPIAPGELVSVRSGSVFRVLFDMLARVVEGNLPAAEQDRRKVKPIKGPDALMHAGNVMWNIGTDSLAHPPALPKYRKT
jgi:hypothetical protein